MLKMACEADKKRLSEFCAPFPLGARIVCGVLSYGLESGLFSVWYGESGGEINCAVSLFGSAATIAANNDADFEELSGFLSSLGFDSLCAESETFDSLKIKASYSKSLYEYSGGNFPPDCRAADSCELKSAYNLISRSIPNAFSDEKKAYLCWLSDYTYRSRRNLSRLRAVSCGERVLACAFTAAEGPSSAIISGVACDEKERGQGLGKAVVLSLADALKKENKRVYVIALGENAGAFYEKIGFIKKTEVSYLERTNNV